MLCVIILFIFLQEEYEDTKGVIRIRKSKKDRQRTISMNCIIIMWWLNRK
jgi:hypothetical protein